MLMTGVHMVEQPAASKFPIPPNRSVRNTNCLGYLFVGISTKIAELNYLCGPRIRIFQGFERFIEQQQVNRGRSQADPRLVESNANAARTALLRAFGTRVIHQDSPHLPARNGEKMSAVLDI
jgi:hypothetical protein